MMVNVKMLSVGHIFIVMLSAVMPSAIMLVVVAPAKHHFTIYKKDMFDEYIGVGKKLVKFLLCVCSFYCTMSIVL
jgi:hypothetical protein